MGDIGALPPHVNAERATDILWTVLSPDVYDLLVAHRGWTIDDFEAWAIGTLTDTLVHPRPPVVWSSDSHKPPE